MIKYFIGKCFFNRHIKQRKNIRQYFLFSKQMIRTHKMQQKQSESINYPLKTRQFKLGKIQEIRIPKQKKFVTLDQYLESKIRNLRKFNYAMNFNANKEGFTLKSGHLKEKENVDQVNTRFGILSKNTIVRSINSSQVLREARQEVRKNRHSRKASYNFSRQVKKQNQLPIRRRSLSTKMFKKREDGDFGLNPWKYEMNEHEFDLQENIGETLPI